MLQKIIKIGNSLAFTIPKSFIDQTNFKVGDELEVQQDPHNKTLLITSKENANKMKLSPDLFQWIERIEKKYSKAIKELAKL